MKTFQFYYRFNLNCKILHQIPKVDLPDFQDNKDDLSPEKYRSQLKKLGIQPHKYWNERVFYISNTGAVLEPYVPPEGDGKLSAVSVQVGYFSKLNFCIAVLL